MEHSFQLKLFKEFLYIFPFIPPMPIYRHSYMSASQYTSQEQVYSNPASKVTVYKCLDSATSKQVAVKWLGCYSSSQADAVLMAFRIQKSLEHPGICQAVNCFQQTGEDGMLYAILVTEWMEKRDLLKEIRDRKKKELPWREEELWVYMRALVSALAFAQMRKITHRDIKPQNIYIDSENQMKIGDFSSAFEFSDAQERELEIVGTPYFLSPCLRAALATNSPTATVHHDSFKSDVFSLGLTCLYMAKLEPIIWQNTSFTQENVYSSVDSIAYSDAVKQMLKLMLVFDETQRPDFLSIEKWLDPSPEANHELVDCPSKLLPYSEQTEVKCPTCFLLFPCKHPPTDWRFNYPQSSGFCSADCYMLMKDVIETPHNPVDYLLCAFCRQWTHDPWRLDCSNHGVCSQKCGRALVENTTKLLRDQPVCPECSVPLTWPTVVQFFEGNDETTAEASFYEAQQILQDKMCEICNYAPAERVYSCGHVFCGECFYIEAQIMGGFLKCPHPEGCDQVYFSKKGK